MRFLIGLLGGLFAGRIVSQLSWRHRLEELEAELAALRNDRAAAWQIVGEVESERNLLRGELDALRQLGASLQPVTLPEATGSAAAALAAPAMGDDLRLIHGIGQVFAQRLNEAGVQTFADLAARTPEELREIVKARTWQDVDTAAWIAEARQHAGLRDAM